MATSPSTSKATEKQAALGKWPECNALFSRAKYAIKCCVCKRNFHSQCINSNNAELRTTEMIAVIKSVENSMICRSCEETAIAAIAEQKMMQQQMAQMTAKLRAKEQEAERVHNEQLRQMEEVRKDCQGVITNEHRTMAADFLKLRDEHERTKREMAETERANAARFQQAMDEATSEIMQKSAVAGLATQQKKELEAKIIQLTAENQALANRQQQANHSMEIDHPHAENSQGTERTITFERFNDVMAEHQRRLNETILQMMTPLQKHISDTVDARMAMNMRNTNTFSVPSMMANAMQKEEMNPQMTLLKPTDSTFADALYTNSAEGKFSIIVPEDQQTVIDEIEGDYDLTDCGTCQIIERRTPTSLAITIDEATSICIKEKLRQRYATAEIREPDTTPKYRIKITGCKAVLDIENGEPTEDQLADAEHNFRKTNRIPNEKLFKIERMWTLAGKTIRYTNYVAEVDALLHKKLIRQGKINEGFAQRRVTEHIDLLQCKKCWRFGHLKKTCTFAATCKICAMEHATEDCESPQSKPVCVNCVRYNQSMTQPVPTSHSVAADNCPVRINRIERLKIFFRTPQKQLVAFDT